MRKNGRRAAATICKWAFVLIGVAMGAYNLYRGEGRVLLGFGAVLFLLIPPLVRLFRIGHPYLLYCVVYAFCILAYDVGCVWQGFDSYPFFDKVAHFLSGIVFTICSYCIYFYLQRLEGRPGEPCDYIASTWALFFSIFIAVMWEIGEFTGYLLTGHDSQHHEDTGVFDTMGDLISCLIGSLLCVASYLLFAKKGVRLLTGAVVEEFKQVNRDPAES